MTNPDAPELYHADVDAQVRTFIGQHREMLAHSLDGLTEAQARQNLVTSKTTPLGLVKHATFVERVWFEEAPSGKTRSELGIAENPDESFDLAPDDTIASVLSAFQKACDQSRRAIDGLTGDVVWTGNRRGPLTLRWIQLHVLREQLLADRPIQA